MHYSLKFISYSPTTNTWNYYANVQSRYFLEDEHEVHKCVSRKNLADCLSDLNPLLVLINITDFISLVGQTQDSIDRKRSSFSNLLN